MLRLIWSVSNFTYRTVEKSLDTKFNAIEKAPKSIYLKQSTILFRWFILRLCLLLAFGIVNNFMWSTVKLPEFL